jgi:hypothetical protein
VLTEPGIYEDARMKVLRTKKLKGHKERIMVVSKSHRTDEMLESDMINQLKETGRQIFNYAYKFVILGPDFATVPEHKHFIATDLDSQAEDYEQVMGTTWIKVVSVRAWRRAPTSPVRK